MKVAAVVVNWNGGERNLACLESLRAQGAELSSTIFVDNGSQDGSWQRVAERYPETVVLRNGENLGFGAGSNRGIAAALEGGAEGVLLVNNDVTLEAGTLGRLVAALEQHPEAGLVGPRVLDQRDPSLLWAAGGALTWRENLTTLLGSGEPDGQGWRRTFEVDYLTACAVLVRREVFEEVGAFDERFFAYSEDVDLALRAARAGYRSLCVGEAAALHEPSSTTGGGYSARRKYMMGVNSVWFLRRWAGPREWLRFLVFDVLTLPPLLCLSFFRGEGRAACAKALGIWDGLRGRRVSAERLAPGASWLW